MVSFMFHCHQKLWLRSAIYYIKYKSFIIINLQLNFSLKNEREHLPLKPAHRWEVYFEETCSIIYQASRLK